MVLKRYGFKRKGGALICKYLNYRRRAFQIIFVKGAALIRVAALDRSFTAFFMFIAATNILQPICRDFNMASSRPDLRQLNTLTY